MGKFGDAFDDEFSKARSAAQLEQDKRDAIKAKREAAFRPLQEKMMPLLDRASEDLSAKGITIDRHPKLSGLQDGGRQYLMFRLNGKNNRPTSIYSLSVSEDGTLLASKCDPGVSYRNADENILSANIQTVTEAEIEGVMLDAVRELARKSK